MSQAMAILGKFENKSALITGGLGFIGSNLARRLVGCRGRVTIVDSLDPEYGGNLFNIAGIEERVQVNVIDVRDSRGISHLIEGQNYLFNLAGQSSHLDSMHNPQKDLEVNCSAQLSLLDSCRKYNPNIRVVFASTRQIYGRPNDLPVKEDHPLCPVDINGINKLAGECYHMLYNKVYGLRACALRLTNTYGPGMRVKDARQTFLGVWIKLLVEGKSFEVWEGHQLRDFTYVDDAVDALLMAAASDQANGQVFNLGGTRAISLKDLADLLVKINGGGEYNVVPFPVDRKGIDIGSFYADYSFIQRCLGWEPRTCEREGLARTLRFYREHLKHYL